MRYIIQSLFVICCLIIAGFMTGFFKLLYMSKLFGEATSNTYKLPYYVVTAIVTLINFHGMLWQT